MHASTPKILTLTVLIDISLPVKEGCRSSPLLKIKGTAIVLTSVNSLLEKKKNSSFLHYDCNNKIAGAISLTNQHLYYTIDRGKNH